MNEHTIEAIAQANAHLNNVDMPTYSETLEALKSAPEALRALVLIKHIPANNAGLRNAMNVLNRIQS